MRIALEEASPENAAAVAKIRTSAAEHLTTKFGKGHWSSPVSEKAVLFEMKYGTIFMAQRNKKPIATLTLSKKNRMKPGGSGPIPCAFW